MRCRAADRHPTTRLTARLGNLGVLIQRAGAMAKQKVGGPPAGESWCWYSREMLVSPAFREMSVNCRRFISALEMENMSHAGAENARLILPYNQLQRSWGIPRRLIRKTIDEARERGLIEERRNGWQLSYAKSMPNTYRLTFRPTREGNPPRWIPATDEWRRYKGPRKRVQKAQK